MRYVETNPVKAKIVTKAEEYLWSSARARVLKLKDDLLSDFFLIGSGRFYFLVMEYANWCS